MFRLIYYIELCWLLIDSVSGYFLNKDVQFAGNQSLGGLFRLLFIPFFLYFIAKYADSRNRLKISFLMFLVVIIPCVHVLYYQLEINDLVADLQFNLKLMIPILLYSIFDIQLKKGMLPTARLRRIIWFNSIILLTNLFLGVLGYGFGSYGIDDSGEMLGSKGFFYAGNEVSAALIALFALAMYSLKDKLSQSGFFASFVLLVWLIAAVSLITKTAILGFLLIALYFYHNSFSFSTRLKVIFIFSFFVLITSGIWLPIAKIAIERWDFFYSNSADFISFLTSGRSSRFNVIADIALDPVSILFGHGVFVMHNKFSIGFEIDLLDMIATSGFFGLVVYIQWLNWLYLSYKKALSSNGDLAFFSFYLMVIFLVLSLIAGHVTYSTMAAPFVILILMKDRFSQSSPFVKI